MANDYEMEDLLSLLTAENAEGLLITVGRPPVVILGGGEHTIEGPVVTRENAAQLFQAVATPEQRRELDRCGDVKFVFVSDKASRFGIRATLRQNNVALEIDNFATPGPDYERN
jgi:Tfp pilus assembly ATPase PilU